MRLAQARFLRTSVGGSSAAAEARFGVENEMAGGTSTWCGAVLVIGFGLGFGFSSKTEKKVVTHVRGYTKHSTPTMHQELQCALCHIFMGTP